VHKCSYKNLLNALSLGVYGNKKEGKPAKVYTLFLTIILMQIYSIKTFYGAYTRTKTPNTFTSNKGVSLILKTRKAPKAGQPKHYLVYQLEGVKPKFFSSMWCNVSNDYTISDTQKKRATCRVEGDTLTILAKTK